ncbi:hypothetical protein ElyMa_007034800 [Elysia marginata]|uniref:Uncharacterized protein n=1 Tax=Elysia marginata TaxID=1093978 RepID=A0AAV4JUT1_9GAST|nr:hypothetical protein ElyMa_007034800 [Elysia marginata]
MPLANAGSGLRIADFLSCYWRNTLTLQAFHSHRLFATAVDIHGNRIQTYQCRKCIDCRLIQFCPLPLFQVIRDNDTAIAHPLQPVNRQLLGFPQPTHLPVTSFQQADMKPVISTFAPTVDNVSESGQAIFQLYPAKHITDFVLSDISEYTHGIFALNLVRRMHQAISQFAIRCEQQ